MPPLSGVAALFCLAVVRTGDYLVRVLALQTRPHTLKKLFQLLFVSLGCLQLAGGPFCAMQIYAWAGMLVTYSQDGGIVKAAKETFSGEKPCALCCHIAAEQKKDSERPEPIAPVSGSQLAKQLQEMIPAGEIHLTFPRPCEPPPVPFAGVELSNGDAANAPPVPPPRTLV